VSIDSAERYGLVLRRLLRSAERLSDAAICFGSRKVNTPPLRSSASLVSVTRFDQRRTPGFVVALRRAWGFFVAARFADFFVALRTMAGPRFRCALVARTPVRERRSGLHATPGRLSSRP
jgi:hypothetical protein